MESEPLEWEELVASLTHELPQPVRGELAPDGATVYIGGEPPEVVVRLPEASLSVSEFAVDWRGPHESVVRPVKLGAIRWRRLPGVEAVRLMDSLIRAARDRRRSAYRPCHVCEQPTPPELMQDDDTCQSCGDRAR
jgi:hypothetical protein